MSTVRRPKKALLSVSERLKGTPVRYFKRGGRTMARCQHCGTLVRGGMRGIANHAKDCEEWSESARLMIQTPYEVKTEIVRLNRELAKCKAKLRTKR